MALIPKLSNYYIFKPATSLNQTWAKIINTTNQSAFRFMPRKTTSSRYLYLQTNTNGSPGPIRVSIKTQINDLPGSTIASTTASPTGNLIWNTIDFGSPVSLNSGTNYWVVIQADSGTFNSSNYYLIYYSENSLSNGGIYVTYPYDSSFGNFIAKYYNGSSWISDSFTDQATVKFMFGDIGFPVGIGITFLHSAARVKQKINLAVGNYAIDGFKFRVSKNNNPNTDILYEIRDNSDTLVRSGTAASAASITGTDYSIANEFTVSFSPVTVLEGQNFYVVLTSNFSSAGNTFYAVSATPISNYTGSFSEATFGGASSYVINPNNTSDLASDLALEIYGEELPTVSANFVGSPRTGTTPTNVSFTDTSTGSPDDWLWDFGDGGTSTSQNPTHNYTSTGTYTVELYSSNGVTNDTETKTGYIVISPNVFSREAKGTIVLGGSVSRKLHGYREAKGTILIGGQANGFIRRDTDALEEKTILYKVYDEDGTYIEVWKDVITEPTFSQEINSTGSTMVLELARNSDSLGVDTGPLQTEAGTTITTEDGFPILASVDSRNQVGPGSSVNHNNRVDVYVFYGSVEPLLTEAGEEILTEDGETILATVGAPNGLRIFTGFISDFSTRYGDTESTIVELSSYGWDLDQYPITNDDGDTKVVFNSYDPSDIAREAMDKFTEDATADGLAYDFYTMRTPTSISTTSTVVSYTFNNNTYADVLQKVVELMPSNWYYYVGLGDNTVYYRERSSEATHTFFLGKHIKTLDLRASIGDSTNRVIFTGGEVTPGVALFNNYTETPATRTRRRLEQNSDGRVILDSSADILSNGVIDSKNKIQYRSTINILSKQYDIESINVGDMIGFRNFGNYVDALKLQVVAKTYTPDVLTIQLDSITPSINKRLEDLKRQLKIQENLETPDAPS